METFREFAQTYELSGSILGYSLLVWMCFVHFRKTKRLRKSEDSQV